MLLLTLLVLGGALALLFPDRVLTAQPVAFPSFALAMFLTGSQITTGELKDVRSLAARTATGLLVQYTSMPLLALALSSWLSSDLEREGFLLIGCLPPAVASPILVRLIGGDLALSAAITTLGSLASPLIMLFWMPILLPLRSDIPVTLLARGLLTSLVLPLAAGVVLRNAWMSRPPTWWSPFTRVTSVVAIALIISVTIAANAGLLGDSSAAVYSTVLALNLLGYAVGCICALLLRWPRPQRLTLTIEVGMQNAGIGALLALTYIGSRAALPNALFAVFCVSTSAVLALLARGRSVREPLVGGEANDRP